MAILVSGHYITQRVAVVEHVVPGQVHAATCRQSVEREICDHPGRIDCRGLCLRLFPELANDAARHKVWRSPEHAIGDESLAFAISDIVVIDEEALALRF